jgi:hypothetical protein
MIEDPLITSVLELMRNVLSPRAYRAVALGEYLAGYLRQKRVTR